MSNIVSGAFGRRKQRGDRNKKAKTKTYQTWVWVQTSKSLQTVQNYMYKYISRYNLKQEKIITIKYVLSEFKERRDFPGCGD